MSDVKVLKPFMSFNTAEITKAWAGEWGEEPGREREDWQLINWPVLADGRIALIYCLYDEVASDAETHNVNHYRILIYDMIHGMKLLEKRRFKLNDAYLHQVYFKNGELWTVERNSNTGNYYTLPNWPVRDKDRGYRLFYDLTDVTAKSDGTLVVGYNTQRDKEERISLMEFGDGHERRYREEKVLLCECVNLDKDEDEWGFMVPQMELVHFTEDGLESFTTEMAGFNGFSLSDDRQYLLADFGTGKSDDRLYLMRRTGENRFEEAVECVIEDEHEGWLGAPRAMKNRMVFRKGDWLVAVDVNECSEGNGGKEDSKEIGFRMGAPAAPEINTGSRKKNKPGQQPQNRVIGFQYTETSGSRVA